MLEQLEVVIAKESQKDFMGTSSRSLSLKDHDFRGSERQRRNDWNQSARRSCVECVRMPV